VISLTVSTTMGPGISIDTSRMKGIQETAPANA